MHGRLRRTCNSSRIIFSLKPLILPIFFWPVLLLERRFRLWRELLCGFGFCNSYGTMKFFRLLSFRKFGVSKLLFLSFPNSFEKLYWRRLSLDLPSIGVCIINLLGCVIWIYSIFRLWRLTPDSDLAAALTSGWLTFCYTPFILEMKELIFWLIGMRPAPVSISTGCCCFLLDELISSFLMGDLLLRVASSPFTARTMPKPLWKPSVL